MDLETSPSWIGSKISRPGSNTECPVVCLAIFIQAFDWGENKNFNLNHNIHLTRTSNHHGNNQQ